MKKFFDKKILSLKKDDTYTCFSKELHLINLNKVSDWNFIGCYNLRIINTPNIKNTNWIASYRELPKIKILNYRKLSVTNRSSSNLKFYGKIQVIENKNSNNKYWLNNNKLKNLNFEPLHYRTRNFQDNHNIIITKRKINI